MKKIMKILTIGIAITYAIANIAVLGMFTYVAYEMTKKMEYNNTCLKPERN